MSYSKNRNNQCLNNLELKTYNSKDVKKVIELVTAKMETTPVGTFKYKVFKYPGDIDIFEDLDQCCTYNVAKISAAQKIQKIVKDIKSSPNVIFSEFKAGYDLRYKVNTGVVDGKIEDYHAGLLRRDLSNIYEAGLFTKQEFQEMIKLVKDIPIIEELILLDELLRSFWVMRWTEEEVLAGHKLLRGNYRLFLDVAVSQGSIVKLDVISYIDGRYVEVTNFFLITLLDGVGNRIILSEELKDYGSSLLGDVYKYYESNKLKSIKRLWMYLAFKGKYCDLGKFNPLFSSKAALYSQIIADIETALILLKIGKSAGDKYQPKLLFDSLNSRLMLLEGVCLNEPLYENVSSAKLIDIVKNLTTLKDCLKAKVNKLTEEWLRDNSIDIFSLI